MTTHGLLPSAPAPSRELLNEWLDRQGIIRGESLTIEEMEDGDGWKLMAGSDMDLDDLICAIPKTAILSHKTSSLPPLPPGSLNFDEKSMNSITILHLSLCLLHEFRLDKQSPFYGYLQSLPREIIGLPIFWDIEEVCGSDGNIAKKWLEGTEVERELRLREEQGLGLLDIQKFYSTFSSHLPPTPLHPKPSPIISFYYCFSLISSRAFMIDIYHLIALCPFADILNHSASSPNTSLSSDDFVCHQCGSLKTCDHDITNHQGISYRLVHLGIKDIQRIENDQDDTVELRIERPIKRGEEICNSYGEDLGDSKLLAEWGFITEDFTGEGLTWDLDQLGLEEQDEIEQYWEVVDKAVETLHLDQNSDSDNYEKNLSEQSEGHPRLLNLDQSGKISINIFALLWVSRYDQSKIDDACCSQTKESGSESLAKSLGKAINELEAYGELLNDQEKADTGAILDESIVVVAKQVRNLLKRRLENMYKSDLPQEELFDIRDSLSPDDRYQYMAMSISINERVLLHSALDVWDEIISSSSPAQA